MKYGIYRRLSVKFVDGVITLGEDSRILIRHEDIEKGEEEILHFDECSKELWKDTEHRVERSLDNSDRLYCIVGTRIHVKAKEDELSFFTPLTIRGMRDILNAD